jgi:hypothetical protein
VCRPQIPGKVAGTLRVPSADSKSCKDAPIEAYGAALGRVNGESESHEVAALMRRETKKPQSLDRVYVHIEFQRKIARHTFVKQASD